MDKSQKKYKKIESKYNNALRRIFAGEDGQFVLNQWKQNLWKKPCVDPKSNFPQSCFNAGNENALRDLMKIIMNTEQL